MAELSILAAGLAAVLAVCQSGLSALRRLAVLVHARTRQKEPVGLDPDGEDADWRL